MSDIEDPDLKKLMDELTQAEGSVSAAASQAIKEEAIVPAEVPVPAAAPPVPKSEPIQDVGFVESFAEPKVTAQAPTLLEPEIEPVDERVIKIRNDVAKLLEGYIGSSEKMLAEFEVDRKKCDDLYNLLVTKIQGGEYSGADGVAIVQLLQTKSDISSNRSRHMDSIAKLLAAIKSNPVVGTGDEGGGGSDDSGPSRAEVNKLLSKHITGD